MRELERERRKMEINDCGSKKEEVEGLSTL
jgi:hypothetical protein